VAAGVPPVEMRKPSLNGYQVMRLLGLVPGPDVGKAMNMLLDLEDEFGFDAMDDESFASQKLVERWLVKEEIQQEN